MSPPRFLPHSQHRFFGHNLVTPLHPTCRPRTLVTALVSIPTTSKCVSHWCPRLLTSAPLFDASSPNLEYIVAIVSPFVVDDCGWTDALLLSLLSIPAFLQHRCHSCRTHDPRTPIATSHNTTTEQPTYTCTVFVTRRPLIRNGSASALHFGFRTAS